MNSGPGQGQKVHDAAEQDDAEERMAAGEDRRPEIGPFGPPARTRS
jgi:hypothetical protein